MIDFPIIDSHIHLLDQQRFAYSWAKDAPALAKSLPRQALHATQVTFLRPVTNMEMCYSSPVPNDIAGLIASMS